MDYPESSEIIGTPIKKILLDKKKKHKKRLKERFEDTFSDEDEVFIEEIPKKRQKSNNQSVDYFSIITNGVIAAGIFVVITTEQIQSLYGSYIPQFYSENNQITFKGKIIQAVLMIVLFVIIKVWVLDSKA